VSRDDGFPHADISVGLLRDIKIRRLRQYGDEAVTTLLYLAIVLSSWEEGFRLTADEADSFIPATSERVTALQAVGLLDEEGMVPVRVWEAWFRPAWERRDKKRVGGIEGNRRRWHPDRLTQSDTDSHTDSHPESPSITHSNRQSPTSSKDDGTTKRNGKEEGVHPDVLARMTPEERATYDHLMGGRP
jgi:hypothetical protein